MTEIKKRLNLRKTAIFLLGLYCLIRGFAYLPISGNTDLPKGLEVITSVIPIEGWGGIWLVVGMLCIVKAFSKFEGVAIPFATGLMAGWGCAYLIGWILTIGTEETSRGWLTASSYLIPAVVIGILSAKGGDQIAINNDSDASN